MFLTNCAYAKLNFEIELFVCIEMDLALTNLQRLIYHKTRTNDCVIELLVLNSLNVFKYCYVQTND